MSGVSGRGSLNEPGEAAPGDAREPAIGSLARAQLAAMAGLRWHIFINGLRSKIGAIELGVRTVMYLVYAGFGLGAGALMCVGAYFVASERQWQLLPILFWALCFLWQVIPVILTSLQEQFDLSILLRFPVSFRSYVFLYVVFGLVDVSTILGALCCLGIFAGITAAEPDLFAWAAMGLVGFALFNILLARAIFAWIDRWLAQRKTREIVGALFMVLLLSLQLLNPALHPNRRQAYSTRQERYENYRKMTVEYSPWLKTAQAVQQWLPPGLAARSLDQAVNEQSLSAWGSLGLLGLYALAAGGVLAGRLRGEFRGESLGQAPKASKAEMNPTPKSRARRARREGSGRSAGSGPIAAVIEKDLRSLLRTLPLLWAIGLPVLMVLVVASLFRNGSGGVNSFPFALPVCMAYALLGFTQLFYNNLGAEGAGIQLLFLSPTPIRTVLLAKNILHSILFGLDALLAATLCTLRLGTPNGAMAAATAAWLVFALPCEMAAGNILSLIMPYRINPGRISRQRGSQANALLSLLIQLGIMGVGAAVFALCWFLDRAWLAVPVFLIMAIPAFLVWIRVLGNVDGIATRRRDTLIATLMKTG